MARVIWNNKDTGEKAQFVAETMNEALFNFSFDSNKVPSLNLHYFCDDYITTYEFVENELMKEGTLIPLNEEFKSILTKSIWLPDGVSEELLKFKNNKGYFEDISKRKDEKAISKYFYDNAKYINSILESENNYFLRILDKISIILNSSTFSFQEKSILYFCVREYLAELINFGVNKGHLYNQTQNILFSRKKSKDDIKYVLDFLKSLLPKRKQYNVVFGISKKIYKELKGCLNGFREASTQEKKQLSADYVAEHVTRAYDPVSALLLAKQSLSALLSVYNSCMHETGQMIFDNGYVKTVDRTRYSHINDSLNLLKKTNNKKKPEREEWLNTVVAKQISSKLLTSFELHNNALCVENPQTQLLTLWTINELLIDSNQNQMNRVNYISNTLCSILSICYYQRKINALLQHIKLTAGVGSIIESESRGTNTVEKLAYIIKDNTVLRNKMIQKLRSHPLDVYKIELLSSVFFNKKDIEKDLNRHNERLRWQIMRIYRYRCMAIHDGSMNRLYPSLNSTLENLHYYVDELFNFIFQKRKKGVYDLDAIISSARIKEASIKSILKSNNAALADDEFYNVIFN